MPRFFGVPDGQGQAVLTGADAAHIRRALRMRPGETLTLCDGQGTDYFCEITALEDEAVVCRVLYHTPTSCEPHTQVTLYQGLPKGDKMEWIVQKAVELGVTRIVPVALTRCVVRLDEAGGAAKQKRWQKIADAAAGQSGRGILPAVERPLRFAQALDAVDATAVVLYEGGGEPLRAVVDPAGVRLSLWVGPEGGLEPDEVEALTARGARRATLGPRILRCETAPLAALAVVMALTGNME